MEFSIGKIAYNIFESYPKGEKLSVNITAKFGVSEEDYSKRVFFLELNIDGEDGEDGIKTRNLIVVARMIYQLDNNSFPDIDEKEIEEDNKYLLELLNRLNETVKNITSQDNIVRPLNINKAIKNFRKLSKAKNSNYIK